MGQRRGGSGGAGFPVPTAGAAARDSASMAPRNRGGSAGEAGVGRGGSGGNEGEKGRGTGNTGLRGKHETRWRAKRRQSRVQLESVIPFVPRSADPPICPIRRSAGPPVRQSPVPTCPWAPTLSGPLSPYPPGVVFCKGPTRTFPHFHIRRWLEERTYATPSRSTKANRRRCNFTAFKEHGGFRSRRAMERVPAAAGRQAAHRPQRTGGPLPERRPGWRGDAGASPRASTCSASCSRRSSSAASTIP